MRLTEEQLEMIADARRVLWCSGTSINYKALANKLPLAESFEAALELRPKVSAVIVESLLSI